MNLKQLKDSVDFIYSQLCSYENPEELTVCIPIDEPSIGGRACVGIESVSHGFDWENGRINVDAMGSIVRKGRSKQDIISPWEHEYDWGNGKKTVVKDCKTCGIQIRKNDKYCSNCGQRLR